MKKVFLGVGHGGTDSGAVAHDKQLEKDLNLSIAKACGAYLERSGVLVQYSRTRDEADPVDQEVRECNAFGPDLAVDIHNNAGGGDGAEVYHSKVGGLGKTLAVNILAEITKLGQRSRGAKTRLNSSGSDYYAFIRDTKAHAVIVECAFLDSADLAIIDTEAERVRMGEAIARGILKTLGVSDTAKNSAPRRRQALPSTSGGLCRQTQRRAPESEPTEGRLRRYHHSFMRRNAWRT